MTKYIALITTLLLLIALQVGNTVESIIDKKTFNERVAKDQEELRKDLKIADLQRELIEVKQEASNLKQKLDNYELFREMTKHLQEDKANIIYKLVISLSDKYSVDSNLILATLYSESRFRHNVKHKHSKVIGIGGIHTGYWAKPLKKAGIIESKEDLKELDKNIEATIFIIKHFLDKHDQDVLEALHSYKGRGYDKNLNSTGKTLAENTYNIYLEIASNI